MRFHCGISFSWKSIKKFLFPILIGLLAYFGFNFIYDKESIPLGFINVYAEENDVIEDFSNNSIEDNYDYWSSILSSNNESIVHKPLHDKIYWFDDNSSDIGILSSIYILLFLYCLTMIVFRILTFIKNVRW